MAIGKIDQMEVDFIAMTVEEKIYIQVTEAMTDEEIRALNVVEWMLEE